MELSGEAIPRSQIHLPMVSALQDYAPAQRETMRQSKDERVPTWVQREERSKAALLHMALRRQDHESRRIEARRAVKTVRLVSTFESSRSQKAVFLNRTNSPPTHPLSTQKQSSLAGDIKVCSDTSRPSDDLLYRVSAVLVSKKKREPLSRPSDLRERLGLSGESSADEETLYRRTARLKWRRAALRDLTMRDEESGGFFSVDDLSESFRTTGRSRSVGTLGSAATASVSEIILPCAVANCPLEATLWSPVERQAYCAACWPQLPYHLGLPAVVAPEALGSSGASVSAVPSLEPEDEAGDLAVAEAACGTVPRSISRPGRYFSKVRRGGNLSSRTLLQISGSAPLLEAKPILPAAPSLPMPTAHTEKGPVAPRAGKPSSSKHPLAIQRSSSSGTGDRVVTRLNATHERRQMTGLATNIGPLEVEANDRSTSHVEIFKSKAVFTTTGK